jgi:hypothetical protein
MTKQWNKASIQDLVRTNDRAAVKALLTVYRNQTDEEQAARVTRENNGVGFTGVDSGILSAFAEQVRDRGFLSPKQMAILRNKIVKYWRQLLAAAEMNGHSVVYK